MVERYKGPGPDGKQIATWYRLSRQEARSLLEREIVPLEQGKTLDDIEDSEIMALPGQEPKLEELIKSWGLNIFTVNKG